MLRIGRFLLLVLSAGAARAGDDAPADALAALEEAARLDPAHPLVAANRLQLVETLAGGAAADALVPELCAQAAITIGTAPNSSPPIASTPVSPCTAPATISPRRLAPSGSKAVGFRSR